MPKTSRKRAVCRAAGVPRLVEELLTLIVPVLTRRQCRRVAARLHGGDVAPDLTVAALCRQYLKHARVYYRPRDVRGTSETSKIEYALRPLRRLFGRQRVSTFGPRRLREVRDEMIRMGWCRQEVNRQVGRIKRMFKWAAAEELIPASVYHALQAVVGVRAGRTTAREAEPVRPVPEALIEGVLPHVSPQVAAMIRLQLLTGMRPGEVVIMRAGDIDRSGDVWQYTPQHHKTAHHGHDRTVLLGPQAQAVLAPFLRRERPDHYLFSPKDAERHRRRELTRRRKTPLSCGNVRGSNRKDRPQRRPGERYDTHAYQHAVRCACRKAFPVPAGLDDEQADRWRKAHHWHPHQLRHNAATRLRKEHGLDVAQVVLGHKTLAVTQVYAERDVASARRAMLQHG